MDILYVFDAKCEMYMVVSGNNNTSNTQNGRWACKGSSKAYGNDADRKDVSQAWADYNAVQKER